MHYVVADVDPRDQEELDSLAFTTGDLPRVACRARVHQRNEVGLRLDAAKMTTDKDLRRGRNQ